MTPEASKCSACFVGPRFVAYGKEKPRTHKTGPRYTLSLPRRGAQEPGFHRVFLVPESMAGESN